MPARSTIYRYKPADGRIGITGPTLRIRPLSTTHISRSEVSFCMGNNEKYVGSHIGKMRYRTDKANVRRHGCLIFSEYAVFSCLTFGTIAKTASQCDLAGRRFI